MSESVALNREQPKSPPRERQAAGDLTAAVKRHYTVSSLASRISKRSQRRARIRIGSTLNRKRDGPPRLTWGMLMGSDFPVMAQNQRRNLDESRIALVQLVARK